MKKWICSVCGYIIQEEKPSICPVCKTTYKDLKIINEYKQSNKDIGVAKQASEEIISDLRSIFLKECEEVGMYLAMSNIASEEGYDKVSATYKKIALEEAEHASKLAQLLGEIVKPLTKENLASIVEDEYEAIQIKLRLAKKAKELGLDIIYEELNKMCRDEARHGKEFICLLNEYFTN